MNGCLELNVFAHSSGLTFRFSVYFPNSSTTWVSIILNIVSGFTFPHEGHSPWFELIWASRVLK